MSASYEPNSGSDSESETGPPPTPPDGIPDSGGDEGSGPDPEELDERLHQICGDTFASRTDLKTWYAQELVDLQRTPYHEYDFGSSPWSPDFTTHVTVGPGTGPADIAESLVEGSRAYMRGDPMDAVRTVYDEAKGEVALVGAGGAAIAYGLTNPGDAAVMGAQIPTSFLFEVGFGLGGAGAAGLHNKLGPRSLLCGVKSALRGERPVREEHQDVLDSIREDLYIVDTSHRDRDMGELDDIVVDRGYDGLEKDGIMAGAAYEAMKTHEESDDDPCSFYAMVLDGTPEKFRLRYVVDEYTDVGTVRTAHDAVASDAVHRVGALV